MGGYTSALSALGDKAAARAVELQQKVVNQEKLIQRLESENKTKDYALNLQEKEVASRTPNPQAKGEKGYLRGALETCNDYKYYIAGAICLVSACTLGYYYSDEILNALCKLSVPSI